MPAQGGTAMPFIGSRGADFGRACGTLYGTNNLALTVVVEGCAAHPEAGSCLPLNGLRVSEATGADIEYLGLGRGHRTLAITCKGGKIVTIPLAPRTARAIDLATGERCDGPIFLTGDGRAGLTRPGGAPAAS